MKIIGIALWAGGLIVITFAMFIFDPTLDGSHVNLDLQQRQMMLVVAGAALFVGGAVLHGMSALKPKPVDRITLSKQTSSKAPFLPETIEEPDFRNVPFMRSDISDEDIARQQADAKAFNDLKGI